MDYPDLFGKSRRIATLSYATDYQWINPNTLLLLRPALGSQHHYPFPVESGSPDKVVCTAHQWDISTGQETPLRIFNDQHSHQLLARRCLARIHLENEVKNFYNFQVPPTSLSPDGRWLLWKLRSGEWRTATLDGAETIDWPQVVNDDEMVARRHGIWVPGNRRWIEPVSVYEEDLYRITELRLRRRNDLDYGRTIEVSGLADGLTAGITAHRSLLMYDLVLPYGRKTMKRIPPSAVLQFSEVSLLRRKVKARRFAIRIPMPGVSITVRVSPEGNRLAWIIQHYEEDESQYCLWTSDLDGNEFQEIGWAIGRTEQDEKSPTGIHYRRPRSPEWSPDGTQISFTFGDEVLVVGV